MPIACFLDTNVVIYAAAGKNDEADKRRIALELIRTESFGISAQVLAEFADNCRRRFAQAMPPSRLDEWLATLAEFPCVAVDADLVRTGASYAARYGIRYYDGAILAAAERLGAPILYTEDLNHGQSYGPVRVLNPFRTH